MPFLRRGLAIETETTEAAELDIALYQVTESQLEGISESLRTVPISVSDEVGSGVRAREVGAMTVFFILSAGEAGQPVATIMSIRPTDTLPRNKLKPLLEAIAMIRGAAGL